MTPRQRLLTMLGGDIPDCVPVAPDFSNMIPARLTGKPFWDLCLYQDPPIWEAYIAAAKHFNIDSLMDGYFPLRFPEEEGDEEERGRRQGSPPRAPAEQWERFVVFRSPERIITQACRKEGGRRRWAATVDVYYVADPPTVGLPPAKVGLPEAPERWEPIEGVKPVDRGPEGLKRAKEMLGDQGLVGIPVASSCALNSEADIYHYYDNPDEHEQWAAERVERAERRFQYIMSLEVKPDFLCVGGSGTLVFQTVGIFRQLALPAVKRAIELATAAGMPTHVHACGPERELVRIFAEETDLTVIDPLERSPMGDCDLAELKPRWGDKITLKGNLHTTDVMLRGTVEEVIAASKQAIDDAAAGGRFILSTGDQCGRDTPDGNIRAMVETARGYGKY